MDYAPGDSFEGTTISAIYGVAANYIIFRSASDQIVGHLSEEYPAGLLALAEFDRLNALNSSVLRDAYNSEFYPVLASSLMAALNAPGSAGLADHFAAARSFIADRGPVGEVFGQGIDFVVFIDKDGQLQWWHRAPPAPFVPVITEFLRLRKVGEASLTKDEVSILQGLLGGELGLLLRLGSPRRDVFRGARDFLARRLEAANRTQYVATSLRAALALGLILWVTYWVLWSKELTGVAYCLGALGGVVGAAISVIQRGAQLRVRHFEPARKIAFHGAVRVCVGAIFGLLVSAATTANLLLGALGKSEAGLFILAVAGGLSERFVPDMLGRVAANDVGEARKQPDSETRDPDRSIRGRSARPNGRRAGPDV
ncbi:MAG: hypothetical protein M3547_03500 [Acidobacteriota bacterium]|nr:hypothetical protein [Acidobacteriota bacterium]